MTRVKAFSYLLAGLGTLAAVGAYFPKLMPVAAVAGFLLQSPIGALLRKEAGE